MKPWNTAEIKYLSEHANDGADSIAKALNRSRRSVEIQASRYGISVRRSWQCPQCGRYVHKPLNEKTGWCYECSARYRRERIAMEVSELEEEVTRNDLEDKRIQALYSKKYRLKRKKRNQ